jgi:putative DNA primase/helicase
MTFQSAASHKNMMQLSKQYCSIETSALDRDIYLMNVLNGTLDLRSGSLVPPRRENFMTRLAPVVWQGLEAQCEYWHSHINYFLREPGLVGFLQRWFGYCLTGETRERKMMIMYGTGSNGKSIICEAQAEIMGDYSMNAQSEMLLASSGDSIPNDIARLQSVRSVHMSETDQGKRMAEAKVKELTGKDTVTARFLHQEFFSFKPEFKMILRTNHRPTIVSNDNGIWDRIMLIPFDIRIPDQHRRPHDQIEASLRQEYSGILAWMVRGCIEWYSEGLKIPNEVHAASKQYRDDMDSIGQFIGESCVVDETTTCDGEVLWEAYKKWCGSNGEKFKQQKLFAINIKERGYNQEMYEDGRRLWFGIDVRKVFKNGSVLMK